MSDNRNFGDYGQQFKTEIEKAINSGNFSGLNQLVKDTVKTTVSEAADQVKKTAGSAMNAANASAAANRTVTPTVRKNPSKPVVKAKMPVLFRKKGDVSGTVMQVFGWIGVGVFGTPLLIFLILALAFSSGKFLMGAFWFALLSAGASFLVGKGRKNRSRFQRAERYFKLSQRTGYMNIRQLADAVGRKEKFVVKELQALIAKGTFPQGHLDGKKQCFMLTDDTFHEYCKVEEQRAEMEQELAAKAREAERIAAEDENLTGEQKALREMIAEGNDYIRQIRQKNEELPGEIFSQKLYRMEALLKEIFANLEKRPEQMPKMYRLMNYYLPTTLKLVTAYADFEHMSVQGEDVQNAKKEIESTVDIINDAFGELLNQMFSDTTMDVTTDAQVLKTMLAREGLTQDQLLKGGK